MYGIISLCKEFVLNNECTSVHVSLLVIKYVYPFTIYTWDVHVYMCCMKGSSGHSGKC